MGHTCARQEIVCKSIYSRPSITSGDQLWVTVSVLLLGRDYGIPPAYARYRKGKGDFQQRKRHRSSIRRTDTAWNPALQDYEDPIVNPPIPVFPRFIFLRAGAAFLPDFRLL